MWTSLWVSVGVIAFAAILLAMQDVSISSDKIILGQGGYDMKTLVAPIATGALLQGLSGNTACNIFCVFYFMYRVANHHTINPKKIVE